MKRFAVFAVCALGVQIVVDPDQPEVDESADKHKHKVGFGIIIVKPMLFYIFLFVRCRRVVFMGAPSKNVSKKARKFRGTTAMPA